MKLKGKLKSILPEQTGTSKAGKQWTKQEFIIDSGDDYNPEICITAWGETIGAINKTEIGSEIEVSINLYSKPYQDNKYFHNIVAWKIEAAKEEDSNDTPF